VYARRPDGSAGAALLAGGGTAPEDEPLARDSGWPEAERTTAVTATATGAWRLRASPAALGAAEARSIALEH
jgi:hypothetical protein